MDPVRPAGYRRRRAAMSWDICGTWQQQCHFPQCLIDSSKCPGPAVLRRERDAVQFLPHDPRRCGRASRARAPPRVPLARRPGPATPARALARFPCFDFVSRYGRVTAPSRVLACRPRRHPHPSGPNSHTPASLHHCWWSRLQGAQAPAPQKQHTPPTHAWLTTLTDELLMSPASAALLRVFEQPRRETWRMLSGIIM